MHQRTIHLLLFGSCLLALEVYAQTGSEEAYDRGRRHLQASEWEQAIAAFDEAIAASSNYAQAFEARAEAYDHLSEEADNVSKRDIAFLRAAEDRQRAGEIRATRELGYDFQELARRNLFLITSYLLSWIAVAFFVRKRPTRAAWLVLLFLGPLGLFLFIFMFPDEAQESSADEHNHNALRESDADFDDVANKTRPCPHCGRDNSVRTRFCPRCETRLD